jgi:NAD-dependent SIR2 family protein deacetylase
VTGAAVLAADAELLSAFLDRCSRLFVLTGAGCSTESGIPDYRDVQGEWKRKPPIHWSDFARSAEVRRRYWARGLVGWRGFAAAEPNPAHRVLARWEQDGRVHQLVTQNVDGLHQQAGSRRVIDLHGRLDRVQCLDCGWRAPRAFFQQRLEDLNPGWAEETGPPGRRLAPDGDADLEVEDYGSFRVPDCPRCAGTVRPGFVFFGEAASRRRVETAFARLEESDAVLVVGSSLMVWSGYRFARAAAQRGLPLALLNLGATRADDLATLKIEQRCGELLPRVTA